VIQKHSNSLEKHGVESALDIIVVCALDPQRRNGVHVLARSVEHFPVAGVDDLVVQTMDDEHGARDSGNFPDVIAKSFVKQPILLLRKKNAGAARKWADKNESAHCLA